jgi:hypothetical protein
MVNFGHNPRHNIRKSQTFKNDLLSPGLLTLVENNLFAGDLEERRKKDDEALVRRVIYRRRGQGHLESLVMDTDYACARRSRLDVNGQE